MTHFGIICPAATGHLNPMTTLGYELQKRDHQVTVIGILDASSKVASAGLGFRAIGESKFKYGWTAQRDVQQAKLSGLSALKYTLGWLKDLAVTFFQEAPSVIKQERIEALLVDQASPEGGAIADFLDIPFISICSALMLNKDVNIPPFFTNWQYSPLFWARLRNRATYDLLDYIGQPIRDVITEYRREWKLPKHFNYNENYSQLAQISQQPPEFEFPRQNLPNCFHFTGPFSNPASREATFFPFEKLTGQPLIYASMGTLQNGLFGVFQNIASVCTGLDAQLVISLGGSANLESLPELPGNPLVVRYAPQLELLQKTTLTITHAGLNTAMESLSNGVPMVAIPVANDQPGVAARIAWTGCGEVIALSRLNIPKLRVQVEKVLTQESYRNNAVRLQESIRRAGGVSRAADIVEQAIRMRQPVLTRTN
jgi:zeaxanthin glucosyltransferase